MAAGSWPGTACAVFSPLISLFTCFTERGGLGDSSRSRRLAAVGEHKAMAAAGEGITIAVAALLTTCRKAAVVSVCLATHLRHPLFSVRFAPRSGAARFCLNCVCFRVFGSQVPVFCVFVFWASWRRCVFVFSCFGASPQNTRLGHTPEHRHTTEPGCE